MKKLNASLGNVASSPLCLNCGMIFLTFKNGIEVKFRENYIRADILICPKCRHKILHRFGEPYKKRGTHERIF